MEYREFNGRSKIKIYNGDCMELMKDMKENEFDLAIVDPPYGINMDNNAGKSTKYKKSNWDNKPPNFRYFEELLRLSNNQIIWGANHFIETLNKNSSCWLVWDKRENIIPKRTYADAELAWASFNSPVRVFRHYWDGFLQKQKETRIHVTQKPVALYKWLLQNYAKEGNTILDTHLGSGSIAIACWDLGFDLTAFEIDKEYFDKACERIDWHTRQKQLF
jgi:site-specific DNA-methyltransferase (adenine-specific)